ncbi:hypothetical protein BN1708_013817 [Verticillium longisporum]|uniref:F-box domain-containing protein n=1 Tax=Verticillium longisporum TaxID=100787 RepID=A0A0G4LPG5_VERLO|nr:hypothetical protein BN1708_013817 [Verticillium longisporum]
MPITSACCSLCGGAVIDSGAQPSWMARFVALYALNDRAKTTAYVSGPGRREQFTDKITASSAAGIPIEPDSVDPDDGSFRISLMRTAFDMENIPGAPPSWGFPFHASCWEILSHACPQADSSWVQTLFHLCRSLPVSSGLLDWRHDYHGSDLQDDETELLPSTEAEHPGEPLINRRDPLAIPRMTLVFGSGISNGSDESTAVLADIPTASNESVVRSNKTTTRHMDTFAKLPAEILGLIITALPSSDVISLRQASRTVASINLPDAFWKSRFLPGREFDHVFEARQHFSSQTHRGRWRSIYRSMQRIENTPSMENRKRIWKISTSLRRVLEGMQGKDCRGTAVQSYFEPDAPPATASRPLVTAHRLLRRRVQSMWRGCRALHERRLSLPPHDIVTVFVSTINIFGRCYVSGLRILDVRNNSQPLGFINTENEMPLQAISGSSFRIKGFCLAQDQRGIRGLAVILNNGQLTQWIGDHDDIPKRRLVFESGTSSCAAVIDTIQGGFDAFKLVTLSVSADLSVPLPDPDSRLDFRDRAIWYPNIPNPDLTMLGTSGKLYGRALYDEAVARFLAFGNTDDDHARNPTQVTVRMKDNGPGCFTDFREIIISFDPVARQTPVRLGLRGETAPQEESLVIDGPGGERITALDSVYEFSQLLGFTIRTSFGRAADFPAGFRDDISPRASVARSVHCPAKERIVGFWATTDTEKIFDLGLISAQSVVSDEGHDKEC